MTEENKALTTESDIDKLFYAFRDGDIEAGKQLKKISPINYRAVIKNFEPFNYAILSMTTAYIHQFPEKTRRKAELAIDQKLSDLRRDLGPKTPLEQLLVERILVTYIETNYLDKIIAMLNWTQRESDIYLKRQNAAHRRHLTAVKALAQVRRLQLPVVQVNIGENQINAGMVALPEK
ncbi:MAG: hypothetical protein HQM09_24535 [Candidatus Riflebacteria bacterium]|nr:hypothetical protein [Candidatus Riflebacteria bacterium]